MLPVAREPASKVATTGTTLPFRNVTERHWHCSSRKDSDARPTVAAESPSLTMWTTCVLPSKATRDQERHEAES